MSPVSPPDLRDVAPGDLPRVHELNQAAQPHVNGVPPERIAWFAEVADYFRVAETDGVVAGFLIAVRPDSPYDCENLAWFRARHADFLYIDRVVVAEEARGLGLGRRLYDDLSGFAARSARRLACEVNLRPRNDGSLRFHAALGFRAVGTQDTEGGAKTVQLMIRELPRPGGEPPPAPAA
jgi:predicted GNAT superfamily acetyltransferase